MEVLIDDKAGYCFGVVKAIGAAEEALTIGEQPDTSTAKGEPPHLYCLGDIVHNSAEVERLKKKGLVVIDHEQLRNLNNVKVLIRAHGEPPETYRIAAERGIELIDATCPIVLALQQRISCGYAEMKASGGQVVIFGKPGHAEVVGLTGQTDGTALVVSSPEDTAALDYSRPMRLYSQTTKSRDEYRQLISNIEAHKPTDFKAFDTVCNRVANRARELEQFACSVDVLLFVAGANSSNGHYLYEHCSKVQPRTHLITGADELQPQWIANAARVGISGATSTPRWLMEEVKLKIEN